MVQQHGARQEQIEAHQLHPPQEQMINPRQQEQPINPQKQPFGTIITCLTQIDTCSQDAIKKSNASGFRIRKTLRDSSITAGEFARNIVENHIPYIHNLCRELAFGMNCNLTLKYGNGATTNFMVRYAKNVGTKVVNIDLLILIKISENDFNSVIESDDILYEHVETCSSLPAEIFIVPSLKVWDASVLFEVDANIATTNTFLLKINERNCISSVEMSPNKKKVKSFMKHDGQLIELSEAITIMEAQRLFDANSLGGNSLIGRGKTRLADKSTDGKPALLGYEKHWKKSGDRANVVDEKENQRKESSDRSDAVDEMGSQRKESSYGFDFVVEKESQNKESSDISNAVDEMESQSRESSYRSNAVDENKNHSEESSDRSDAVDEKEIQSRESSGSSDAADEKETPWKECNDGCANSNQVSSRITSQIQKKASKTGGNALHQISDHPSEPQSSQLSVHVDINCPQRIPRKKQKKTSNAEHDTLRNLLNQPSDIFSRRSLSASKTCGQRVFESTFFTPNSYDFKDPSGGIVEEAQKQNVSFVCNAENEKIAAPSVSINVMNTEKDLSRTTSTANAALEENADNMEISYDEKSTSPSVSINAMNTTKDFSRSIANAATEENVNSMRISDDEKSAAPSVSIHVMNSGKDNSRTIANVATEDNGGGVKDPKLSSNKEVLDQKRNGKISKAKDENHRCSSSPEDSRHDLSGHVNFNEDSDLSRKKRHEQILINDERKQRKKIFKRRRSPSRSMSPTKYGDEERRHRSKSRSLKPSRNEQESRRRSASRSTPSAIYGIESRSRSWLPSRRQNYDEMKRRSGPPSSQSSMRYEEENRRQHSINNCFAVGRKNVSSSTCSSGRRDEETRHTGRSQYVPVTLAPIGHSMLPSSPPRNVEKKFPRSTRWGPPMPKSIPKDVSPFPAQYRTSTDEPYSNSNSSFGTSNMISQDFKKAEKKTP